MLSDASQSQKDKPWVAHSRGSRGEEQGQRFVGTGSQCGEMGQSGDVCTTAWTS